MFLFSDGVPAEIQDLIFPSVYPQLSVSIQTRAPACTCCLLGWLGEPEAVQFYWEWFSTEPLRWVCAVTSIPVPESGAWS